MSTRIITDDGREFEFVYRDYKRGDHILNSFGEVVEAKHDGGPTAVLRPIPKRHTFGRVVFEETGEERQPQPGEWYLSRMFAAMPLLCMPGDLPVPSPILRPVEVTA